MEYKVRITGKGKSVPQRQVSSAEIESRLNLPADYIFSKLGVRSRHWAQGETNTSMGAMALKEALRNASLDFGRLDLLISASATYDYPLPTSASLIAREFNDKQAVPCMDINSSCLSFISALEVASAFIELGIHKRIAIVSSELASKSLDQTDYRTLGLFGDGAAAFILEKSDGAQHISSFLFKTWPEGAFYTYIPAGGNVNHGIDPAHKRSLFTFHMEGKELMVFTMKKLQVFVKAYEEKTGKVLAEADYIIPHQASRQSLELFRKHYGLEAGRIHSILSDHGNCVAASIPLALYDALDRGKLPAGTRTLLIGTAAGISAGACVITF
jgi:3-oxoacyl-[acyl-carrier-protein] synthase-3